VVTWLRPRVVCFVGLSGYRAAVDRHATAGEQAECFGGVLTYVMPNTSGVNGRVSLDDLVAHLRAATALADR
jgi:predicted metalloprotease